MSMHEIVEGVTSDNIMKSGLTLLILMFMVGMFIKPYQDLPARVDRIERANDELRTEIQAQRRTLDLVVCFLETEAAGGNPLGCSR